MKTKCFEVDRRRKNVLRLINTFREVSGRPWRLALSPESELLNPIIMTYLTLVLKVYEEFK